MKLQEAKETTVFEIEDGIIKEVNLYEKMQRSVDETTSPRGVEPVCFIREIESISIAKKELIVREAKFIRKLQERRAQEKIFNDMANMYASQVLRVPFESKHETEVRVSKQFGRIDKNVFWRVINKVRAEQNQR